MPIDSVFQVHGPKRKAGSDVPPFWTADVQVTGRLNELPSRPQTYVQEYDTRAVLGRREPLWYGDLGSRWAAHLPGTFVVRCQVWRVLVNLPQTLLWEFDQPVLATLALQARPEDWDIGPAGRIRRLPEARCVAGEIPLDASTTGWARYLPHLHGATDLRATGSGLAVTGKAVLPWLTPQDLTAAGTAGPPRST